MASPNDDILLKDGNDLPFKMRAKDTSVAQDGSKQTIRHLATPYPIDYGVGGCYRMTAISGSMAAGLGAAAPVLGFRNPSTTLLAIVRRVQFSAWSAATGFTAGLGLFDLSFARSWTIDDTGGALATLTGNNAKLRTAMGTPSATIRTASTATLTAGTRTLDAQAISRLAATIGAATNTVILQKAPLLTSALAGDHPVVLAQNEGLVIAATVPATGVWSFSAEIEWDEVPLTNF